MLTTEKKSVGGKDMVDNGVLTDGYLSRRRNPVLWLVICGILLIAAIVVGTAMMVRNFRDHAIESSKRELENAVVLLARHFDQQLDDAEVPLADLIETGREEPGVLREVRTQRGACRRRLLLHESLELGQIELAVVAGEAGKSFRRHEPLHGLSG